VELVLQAQNQAVVEQQRKAAEQQAVAAVLAQQNERLSQFQRTYRAQSEFGAMRRGANAVILRGDYGTQLDVELTGRTTGHVWGTDVYTDDSDIPTAAVHAGLLKPGEKGTITMTIVKSPDQYEGCTRNDVTTSPWGQHPSGFILLRKQETTKGPSPIPPPSPSNKSSRRVY
jgi:hypothetical protein